MRSTLSIAMIVLALPGGIQAKELRRTIEGKAGQDLRIGLFGSVRPDCSSERTPPVRIVQPPSHGTIIVGTGQTQIPANSATCPSTTFTVLAIFFRPAADFTGEDQVILEFEFGPNDTQIQKADLVIGR